MAHPGGRPTEYKYKELKPIIEAYIESCVDTEESKEHGIRQKVRIPSIEGLCLKLNISKDTLYAWEKIHKEFSYDIDRVRKIQAERLLNKGLSGDYNPTIAKVLLTKHGYREGIEQTGKDGGPMEVASEDIKKLAEQLNDLHKS